MSERQDWYVLLIGGPSGVGKSTIAAQVARRLGAQWLMVDDLRLALMRSGMEIPDSSQVEPFDAPGGLVAVGEAMAPAIEVVIENHVDQRIPVVIEGDGILPSIFERAPVRARNTNGRIRAVYLYEPDADALNTNLIARGARGVWAEHAYARKSVLYGEWLRAEAEKRHLPVIAAWPRDTLGDRILAATGLSRDARSATPYGKDSGIDAQGE